MINKNKLHSNKPWKSMVQKNTARKNQSRINRYCRKAAIVLFWLAVWAGLALAVDNKILLAAPWETAGELLEMLGEASLYLSVARSLLRIGLGFAAGFAAALLLAAAGSRFRLLEDILSPVMTLIKTVPVASFVVLWQPDRAASTAAAMSAANVRLHFLM